MGSITSLINRGLGTVGLQLVRTPAKKAPAPPRRTPDVEGKARHMSELERSPADPLVHLRYAEFCLQEGSTALAYAEMRTARFLGAPEPACAALERNVLAQLGPLEELAHNRFYRLHSMANAVRELGGGRPVSLLDVGGGIGDLSRFLPGHPYCLAEPFANGISSLNLPFADGTFDLVVSCHVLEHIPTEERDAFLDTLVSKSKLGVVLLNPFHAEGTHEVERMQLVWDELKASWAKEHIDCVLPRVDDVRDYAERRGLRCTVRPNATMSTSFSLVWVDAMMEHSKMRSTWLKLNRFLNTRLLHTMDSSTVPTAYLIFLQPK